MIHLTSAPPAPEVGSISVTCILADGTPVTGRITDLTTRVVDGVLTAIGTITIPDLGTDTFTASVLAASSNRSLTAITLDLGPLHRGVPGPAIDLAPFALDATTVPGSGNLLRNLVYAASLLLNDTGDPAPTALSPMLNQLLFGLGL